MENTTQLPWVEMGTETASHAVSRTVCHPTPEPREFHPKTPLVVISTAHDLLGLTYVFNKHYP